MKKWIIIWISAFSAFSCIKDPEYASPDGSGGTEDDYVVLTLQLPGLAMPASYGTALSEADENRIDEIDVLAFREEASDEVFCYRVQSDRIVEGSGAVNGNRKTIRLKLRRDEYGVRLVVLANSRAAVDRLEADGLLREGAPKQELLGKLTFSGKLWENLTAFTPFPMWGQTAAFIKGGYAPTTALPLLRAVAKIDIGADIYWETGPGPALGFGTVFKIRKVYVYRSVSDGCVAPSAADQGSSQATAPHIPAGATKLVPPIAIPYTADPTENAMFRRIYVPEAPACLTGQEASSTCLVVEAEYYDEIFYYRVDFVDSNGHYLPLLRNHRYLVNIMNVRSFGYATPDEAAEARTQSLAYELEVTEENLEINDIVYNGQYFLGIDNGTKLAAWSQAQYVVPVLTNYGQGWSASTEESWLTIQGPSEGGPGTQTPLRFQAEANGTGSTRTGKITLKAGQLVKEISVTQSMGANCLVVEPGGSTRLPIGLANCDGTTRFTAGQPLKTAVLWQDRPGMIASYDQSFTPPDLPEIRLAQNMSGNAVVAITDASDRILWSWHLWITAYDPDAPYNIKKNNGFTLMDRNLGAHAATSGSASAMGLYYQWGRKDPFPPPAAFTPSTPTAGVSIYGFSGSPLTDEADGIVHSASAAATYEEGILNPMTFFGMNSSYNNWIASGGHNNYWNTTSNQKGYYDPCPEGWRVPTSGAGNRSPWYGWSLGSGWSAGSGWNTFNSGYYPAGGNKGGSYFYEVGTTAYAWTSSAYGFNAYALKIDASAVTPSDSHPRYNALPVRCVRID